MGRLVEMWKFSENDEEVVYLYGSSKDEAGKLYINKVTGEISGDPVPGHSEDDSFFAYGHLAEVRARKMLEEGEFPEHATRAT